MSALKVITETLRYLKDHALECISEHTNGKQFLASDFTWVLTLPAIWDAAAKQFMKKAAVQVGCWKCNNNGIFDEERLRIHICVHCFAFNDIELLF